MNVRFPLFVVLTVLLASVFSCTDMVPTREVRLIDSLNNQAYAYRYRNLDSSFQYADMAYRRVRIYGSGKAEAANNLGFYAFMKMDFEQAETLYKEVYRQTKNELELLIADIGLMKVCQRTAMNKEFYDYRNSAMRRMKRIREEKDLFIDRHEQQRIRYAFSEFFIVSAVYYYYLHQRWEAFDALRQVEVEGLEVDANQWLYYHYIKGSAALVEADNAEERKMEEFDRLYFVWREAAEAGLPYFEGNGLQGLANLMASPAGFDFYRQRRGHILQQFDFPADSLMPLRMAQRALQRFREYDDLYQIAGAYVSIGKYLNAYGRYGEALDTLTKALECVNVHHLRYHRDGAEVPLRLESYLEDSVAAEEFWMTDGRIKTVPEWVSRIREQLSVSYAGLGKKRASDYNRNIYLDLLNFMRQDKELESRYAALEAESKQTTLILVLVVAGMILVVILGWFLNKRSGMKNRADVYRLQKTLSLCRDITSVIPMDVPRIQKGIDDLLGEGRLALNVSEEGTLRLLPRQRLNKEQQALVHILEPYIAWAAGNERMVEALSEERMQLEKLKYIYEQHIAGNKRQNLVKKACLAIVNGITPYIDRMLNETHKLTEKGYIEDDIIKKEKYQYIDELVTTINEYNDILALWIKMKQGTLSLNVEVFALNDLFTLVGKGKRAFEMKQQLLEVKPTDIWVKADRALTLFMINTLAENARKYTQEGGAVRIYACATPEYAEISVEDNGCGLSAEEVAKITGEKVYDSQTIGMGHAPDAQELKKNKGSGFGLLNCKGIIEKYRKTNALFSVCTFQVESVPGEGSRFFFRLPLGMRKTLGVLLGCCFSFSMMACHHDSSLHEEPMLAEAVPDSVYDELLDAASDYANAAYFSNVDEKYRQTLCYIDSALSLLNLHYESYAPFGGTPHRLTLHGEGAPAELLWWNEQFASDYHVILDLRNEAAVAFLALKQLDAYSYNNAAFTDLYKLQGKDQSLENFCRQLEQSNTNKTVGIILCMLLLLFSLAVYYLFYLRKRAQNRLNLEQILEINQKVFTASLSSDLSQKEAEALEREENTLREIPQRIVDEAFNAVDELLPTCRMGIAVYNETAHLLEYASYPPQEMPEQVKRCFESEEFLQSEGKQALPLTIESGETFRCVGVLYIEQREGVKEQTDRLLLALIARYVAIVVFNAVVNPATKYRDIESAHEETHRASWEDSMLHVQNMVLDNCLSTIKHETVYYPNKIKQIVGRLYAMQLSESEEREAVEAMTELMEYYKGIFTILSACASRQLEEVTFRRSVVSVQELWKEADKYFRRAMKNRTEQVVLLLEPASGEVVGDVHQLRYLLENLIDEALTFRTDGILRLQARAEDKFVRFLFTDMRREKSDEELNTLFYPNLNRMLSGEKGELSGTEYLICKQIIREHDEFAGRRGCRINAERCAEGGFSIYFTVPMRSY